MNPRFDEKLKGSDYMFNEDLILICKGIWAKKDEIKQHIEDNNEDAVIGCVAKSVYEIETAEDENNS